jgi:hypothetical protein
METPFITYIGCHNNSYIRSILHYTFKVCQVDNYKVVVVVVEVVVVVVVAVLVVQ